MDPSSDKSMILVVDDDRGAVNLLQVMLQVRGYDVTVAYSGTEALALLEPLADQPRSWQPLPIDLILLDIMMPGIDGFKVCQRVKNDPILKYIPVIMVTALASTSDKVAAIEFGADGYIAKPFLPEELGSAIKAKLQIKRREEELLRRNRELETINAVSSAAMGTLDPDRVLQESLAALMAQTDLAAAAIYLYDEATHLMRRAVEQGVSRPQTLSAEEDLFAQILHGQRATIVNDLKVSRCKRDLLEICGSRTGNGDLAAYMGIPLQGVERSLGMLEIYSWRPYAFETRDLELYTTIGHRIGVVLENAQIFQRAQTLLLKSSALSISKV
jgi:DNA-binding response OmpR family regulator